MSKQRRHNHLVLFLPREGVDTEAFDWRAALERVFPGVQPIAYPEIAAAGEEPQRRAALKEAMTAAGKRGFVITDPPEVLDELRWIDDVCREVFGKRRRYLPKAIFFTPEAKQRAKKGAAPESDPLDGYRQSLRPLYHHYRRDRRAYSFTKTKTRAIKRALKLSKKSKSPVRWGLLLPVTGFIAAVLLLTFVFRDGLLRRGAVAGGQSAFGARVDVADLTTTFEPRLHLDGVAVADREAPLTNLFQFESLAADVDLFALFAGRFHSAEATLSGLAFGTEREESGELEETPVEEEEPSEFKMEMQRRLVQIVEDLQRKLEPPELDDLETTRVAAELAEESRQRLTNLRSSASPDAWRSRFEEARTELRTLVENPVPESVEELRSGLSGLQDLGGVDLDSLQERLAGVAELGFDKEAGWLAKAESNVDAASSDLDAAQKTLKRAKQLEKLDFGSIAKLPGLLSDVRSAIESVGSIEKKLSKAGELTERATKSLTRTHQRGLGDISGLRESLAEAKEAAKDTSGAGDQVAGLSSLFANAKSDVLERKEAVRAARDRVIEEASALQSEVSALGDQVSSDIAFFESARERLEAAVQQDVDSMAERYSLDSLDTDQILATLVGEQAFGWIDTGRNLYRRFHPPTEDGPPKKRADGFGATYSFPPTLPEDGAPAEAKPEQASFHLERAVFDGIFEFAGRPLDLSGSASELSSNPALVGSDAQVDFAAARDGEAVSGNFRFTTDNVLRVAVSANDFRIEDVPFETRYAPERISEGLMSMDLQAAFDGEQVTAEIDLSLRELVLLAGNFSDIDPRISSILTNVYSGFDELDARLELDADAGGIRALRIESDALDGVRSAFTNAVGEQVAELRGRAEEKLAARLEEPRQKALSAIEGFAPEARGLVESLTGESEAAADLLAGDKKAVRQLFSKGLDLPVVGEDGASMQAALEERLNAMSAELGTEEARLDGAHSARTAALDTLLAELGGVKGGADGLEGLLQSELQRLLSLK